MAEKRPPLGQHFLKSEKVLNRIADGLGIEAGRLVIEIGPGKGALTGKLLERGARVVAVELDEALADGLEARFEAEPLRIVRANILDVDVGGLVEGDTRALVAGNLPYYITSPIIRRVFGWGSAVEAAVFLVQKEVGQRIAAQPGSRDYRFLSALSEHYSEREYLFDVPAGAFQPPPKVSSGVVRLAMRTVEDPSEEFVRFLEAAFRQPRKTLTNNLGPRYGRDRVARELDGASRAQQLSVGELRDLWRRLEA